MKWILISLSGMLAILSACESKVETPKNAIEFLSHEEFLSPSDTLRFKVLDTSITNLNFTYQGQTLSFSKGIIALEDLPLGKGELVVRYSKADRPQLQKKPLNLYAQDPPSKWKAELVNTYSHNTSFYTQGLEFVGDILYESTGQRGKSLITSYNPFRGETYKTLPLEDTYFGEGITITNDRVIQLTWLAKKGFIYDLKSLERVGEFSYGASQEGWGLSHDNQYVYKSDGSATIFLLDPNSLEEKATRTISSDKAYFKNANELEIVNDYLFANVYQKNSIMVIQKDSGALVGVLDLGFLADKIQKTADFDALNSVLNGIAYHQERGTFFVTGKNWNLLFEMRFSEE